MALRIRMISGANQDSLGMTSILFWSSGGRLLTWWHVEAVRNADHWPTLAFRSCAMLESWLRVLGSRRNFHRLRRCRDASA
eukprot:8843573-Pyramimonas_sp.AAC.1